MRRALSTHASGQHYVKIALVLAAAHVVLALLMKRYPAVSTAHVWGTLGLGLVWALQGKSTVKLACLGCYIAGAEVLWRMTDAAAFWEMGKYAVIAIFVIAIQNQRQVRRTSFPLGYFILFVPAALFTIGALDFGLARRQVSFNLSGPLALAVSAAFFSRLRLSPDDLKRVLLSFLVPVAAVWTIVVSGIVTATQIEFTTESNRALSGGFGPNQVSLTLGCGALIAFLLALFGPRSSKHNYRNVLFLLAVGLAAQSALTFSRSGLYLAVASGVTACALAARDRRSRTTLVLSGVLLYVVAAWVIAPRLNAFTHGQLGTRFADTNTTGRADLMKADLMVWWDHPVFGVGPGLAAMRRVDYWGARALAAHSEFTRALSEHGLFGLFALGWLGWAVYGNTMRIRRMDSRAIVGGLVAFGLLFLLTNAMRLVMCSLVLGLCFAEFNGPRPNQRSGAFLRRRAWRATAAATRKEQSTEGCNGKRPSQEIAP